MSKKAWIIFAVICVVLLGGLVFLSNKNKVDVSSIDANSIQPSTTQSGDIADHVFGQKESKVILIEYGDYQCPGCGNAFSKLKTVSEKYKDHMAFVFRNFPLPSLHPNARAAAAAAESAGLQGKFWEMHDLLYENQSNWENLASDKRTEFFADYAKTLGLNIEQFKTDMANVKINQKISFDQALGKKIGVDATPSIYLNGEPVAQGTWSSQEALDKAVADLLKEKGVAPPKE